MIFIAWSKQALQLAQESASASFGFDVGNRAGQINLNCAIQDIERGRAELPLTANDFSRLEASLYNRILVEFQKCSRNVLENRQASQKIGIDGPAFHVAFHHGSDWSERR